MRTQSGKIKMGHVLIRSTSTAVINIRGLGWLHPFIFNDLILLNLETEFFYPLSVTIT
jgi:hypothetical protein